MKKYLILIGAFLLLLVFIAAQQHRIEALKQQRNEQQTNAATLLKQMEQYKAADSLNAARVGELTLSMEEYKRYRAADLQLINALKAKNRDLQAAANAATTTIQPIKVTIRDTIIQRDTLTAARCIDYVDNFIELHGCEVAGEFDGTITTRDSLILCETVQFRRFLGFLWKTKQVKNREFNITSRNPRTTISGFEVVTIKK